MSYSVLQPHPLDGIQREGQPRGDYMTSGSYVRYFLHPGVKFPDVGKFKEKNIGLLMFSDETGVIDGVTMFSHDSKMLADAFVAAGYMTILMSSAPFNSSTNTVKTFDANIEKVFQQFLTHRPRSNGSPKFRIVLAGYGRGVQKVLRLLAKPEAPAYRFVAGFVASPFFGDAVKISDYKAVTRPLSLAFEGSAEGANERELIRAALESANCPYQINLYSHVRDGFAWLRDSGSEAGDYAKRTSFVQALQWFKFHLFEDSWRVKT